MMKPRHKAYLAVEASVTNALRKAFEPFGHKLARELRELALSGKFAEAHKVVREFQLDPVIEKIRPKLEELAVTAILFGASRRKNPWKTGFATGKFDPRLTIANSVKQLIGIAAMNAESWIREAAEKVLHDYEDANRRGGPVLKTDEDDLAAKFAAAVLGNGRAVMDIGANLTTSRLAAYGFLAEAESDGATQYQVSEVLDDRTCPVCVAMHGRTFSVSRAKAHLDMVMMLDNPEDLRSAAPWPKQNKASVAELEAMTDEEVEASNTATPPYHPGCRGILVPVGDVKPFRPEIKPIVSGGTWTGLPDGAGRSWLDQFSDWWDDEDPF